MTDVHSHILWDLDNGPAIEESIAMLRAAEEAGTTDIVATPHAGSRFLFPRRIVLERIGHLSSAVHHRPQVHFGCQFHPAPAWFEILLRAPLEYTINGTRYLLLDGLDLAAASPAESGQQLSTLFDAGLTPILAHLERTLKSPSDLAAVERWVDRGCLVQLTARSLTGYSGGLAKTASWHLLERGLAHMVASDAHDSDTRHPRLAEARHAVESRLGERAAQLLFVDTPRAVIAGAPIPPGRQRAWQDYAPWYRFWPSAPSS